MNIYEIKMQGYNFVRNINFGMTFFMQYIFKECMFVNYFKYNLRILSGLIGLFKKLICGYRARNSIKIFYKYDIIIKKKNK